MDTLTPLNISFERAIYKRSGRYLHLCTFWRNSKAKAKIMKPFYLSKQGMHYICTLLLLTCFGLSTSYIVYYMHAFIYLQASTAASILSTFILGPPGAIQNCIALFARIHLMVNSLYTKYKRKNVQANT